MKDHTKLVSIYLPVMLKLKINLALSSSVYLMAMPRSLLFAPGAMVQCLLSFQTSKDRVPACPSFGELTEEFTLMSG